MFETQISQGLGPSGVLSAWRWKATCSPEWLITGPSKSTPTSSKRSVRSPVDVS
jgi:hypothetical protein